MGAWLNLVRERDPIMSMSPNRGYSEVSQFPGDACLTENRFDGIHSETTRCIREAGDLRCRGYG